MAEQMLLTAEELAERLAVSPHTVVVWARAGRIPEIRPSPRIRRFIYLEVVKALRGEAADKLRRLPAVESAQTVEGRGAR